MGQRHQTYIIAKVGIKGEDRRYRCVAAFHWQCLNGDGPPRSATRFLNAVRNPLNSLLVQADLDTFAGYETKAKSWIWREGVATPCPYITMLYVKSTCVSVDDRYPISCSVEPADMRTDGGDNDDGITIFDVTDPAKPRYCMAFFVTKTVAKNTGEYEPLSAEQYVKIYYPELGSDVRFEHQSSMTEEVKREIRTAYERLSAVEVIDIATLAEAWPQEYGLSKEQRRDAYNAKRAGQRNETGKAEEKAEAKLEGSSTVEVFNHIPSLLVLAITKYLEDEDDPHLLQSFFPISVGGESQKAIKNYFATKSTIPGFLIPILAKVLTPLSSDQFVDVSSFALADGQLTKLMELIPTCKILKLGGCADAGVGEVVETMRALPGLQLVILFDQRYSLKQLEQMRRDTATSSIKIAHKYECLEYTENVTYQYDCGPSEFIFITKGKKSRFGWDENFVKCGVGIKVIEDPNFIIQAARDTLSVKDDLKALTTCFTVNQRNYESLFSSSSFITYASPAPKLEKENKGMVQWILLICPSGNNPFHLHYWMYGFIRYQCGSPLQVMDLDDFVEALAKERPDLPAIIGADEPSIDKRGSPIPFFEKESEEKDEDNIKWVSIGEERAETPDPEKRYFTSFLGELRYLLGASRGQKTYRDRPPRRPYELLTVEKAQAFLDSL